MKRLLPLLVVCTVLGTPARAQESVLLEARDLGIGFLPAGELPNLRAMPDRPGEKFVLRDGWATFQVTLVNRGEAVEGVLSVTPDDPGTANPIAYQKRVSLPRGASKRITFPVLKNTVYPFEVTFDDASLGRVPFSVGERATARTLTIGNPRSVVLTAEVFLVATAERSTFAHFLHRDSQDRFTADRVVIPVDPATLPTTAVEYQSADVVVLDDVPFDGLTPAQQSALAQFVCRGGVLVACLARHADRAKGVLEALLPGTPAALKNVDGISALETATGVPCRFPKPQAVMTFAARPGARSWGPDEVTVLHARADRGTVIACGFPFSMRYFETWAGSRDFAGAFATAARPARVGAPGSVLYRQPLRQDLARVLKASIAKSLPPFATVVVLMAAYALAVIVLPYGVFRPLRRLEWAWVAVFAIALAGSGVVWGVGAKYLRLQGAAHRVTLVEGGARPGPHLRHNFWCVFSATGERMSIAFEDAPVVPHPFGNELALRGAEDRAETMRAAYDEDAQIRGMRTFAQDTVLFETTDACTLTGAVRFDATVDDGRLKGLFDVDRAMPLHAAWIAYGGKLHEVRPGPFDVAVASTAGAALPEDASRFFREAFRGVSAEALRVSEDAGAPVLLYRYEGQPGLARPALREESFHFGLVEPAGAEGPASRSQNLRASVRRALDSEAPDNGVDFSLTAVGVPPGHSIASLTVRCKHVPQLELQLMVAGHGSWERVAQGARLEASRYVFYSPLGHPHVRARVVAPERLHYVLPRVGTEHVEGTVEVSRRP